MALNIKDPEADRLARELGVVVRNRKVKALALFWTLVLGFGAGEQRTLAGLRRHFEQASRGRWCPRPSI